MLPSLFLSTLLLSPSASPNVLFILTDDQGWGDLSLHGNTNLRTPNIDQLARDGARFDRFFVQPVCSPTRAEFLTGRYHTRGGVRGVSTGGERLNLNERTIADSFKHSGYRTACVGKWHNGSQGPYHPLARGFDEYYGFTSGHWGDYFDAPLDHNGQEVTGKGYLTDDFTRHAIDFIKTKSDKPFFCFVAYNVPHSPMQVPDESWQAIRKRDLPLSGTGKENREHSRAAYAMCEHLDANIGQLLAAIDPRETIVVYFHDNGPNGPRWNGGMKGTKGTTDEGGVRSPLFIRHTGTIPAGRSITPIAGAVDLLPTLLDLANIKRVGDHPLDGMSFAPWLKNEANAKIPDRVLVQHWAGRVSVRSQTHRLDATSQLFDMVNDPNQTKPLGDTDLSKKIKTLREVWVAEHLKDRNEPDTRPFPVGHPRLNRTVLPARDGVPVGGVKRSANAPNCSFFTNWSKPNDAMTWNVDVLEPGDYKAELAVTVPEKNLGATIVLSAGTIRWTQKLTVAHDPPLRGMENDRVLRVGESYVKTFKSIDLGIQKLPKGPIEFRLSATDIPGPGVADVRQLVLTLTNPKRQ